ncbi:sensor histidine kinase [Frondihabitans peucedani]|uniref:histidine kinase n=1 Tax=Frondihabitans peucedani TaxID=598626 RepID=A0ABP8E3L2_9MICO
MTTETSPMADEKRSLYGSLWRAFPRDVGYLALTGVLALVAGSLYGTAGSMVSGFGDALGSLVLFAILVLAALYLAKQFGRLEILRLGWAREPAPRPVVWRRLTATNRFVRLLEVAADPHYWLYLLYLAVVFPILGGFVVGLIGSVVFGGMAGIAVGIVLLVARADPGSDLWRALTQQPWFFDNLRLFGAVSVVLGLALLALLPLLTRGGVKLMGAVARPLLGGFRSEQLQAEVAGLEVSRSAAVSAEGTALRRLERDIHDGPQQRLIRIQMDLAAASRAVDTDVVRGKALIEEAIQQSRDALEELRALSRGFAPPLLLDRGLAAALDAVVDRSTVATRFTDELPEGVRIPVEIERNAYFIAAELLTNVAKHSGAGRAELILSAPVLGGSRELVVVVTDDGAGGATVSDGHGLAGIEQRLTGLGGTLELRSPAGGPTHVAVRIPVTPPAGEGGAEGEPDGERDPAEVPEADAVPETAPEAAAPTRDSAS